MTTLVDQGVYPDPYYGLNNLAIPDTLCRMDWWYRLEFNSPVPTEGREAWLVFKGINYQAEIWLNDVCLGTMKGAFIRGEFNATDHWWMARIRWLFVFFHRLTQEFLTNNLHPPETV